MAKNKKGKKDKKQETKSAAPKTARQALSQRKDDQSKKDARKSIHPEYVDCKIVCGCGNVVQTRAAVPEIQVGVCSNCHPFFTGAQRFVDSAGRVEKFQKRYQWTAEDLIEKGQKSLKPKKSKKKTRK